MVASEPRVQNSRVLVLEQDPEVREDYCLLLGREQESAQAPALLPGLDGAIATAAQAHQNFPPFDVALFRDADEALLALRRAVENRENFALGFIDLESIANADPLHFIEEIRQRDPDIQLVILPGAVQVDPAELIERLPPADKVMLLYKPFHGGEIQSIALALSAKWRSERARAASLRVGRNATAAVEGDLAGGLEGLPCGLLVFDRHDRLSVVNRTVVQLFPELTEFLVPGTRYEEIQWQLAQRLLPEDTLYRVESWVRDRLEWHNAGGGVFEQRLRGPRWIFLAELTQETGETYCQIFDITDLKRRETSRASGLRLSQIAQALGALYDQLHMGQIESEHPNSSGKVVALHGRDPTALDGLLPSLGPGKMRALASKIQTIAQKQRLIPEPTDVGDVVHGVVDSWRNQTGGEREIEVITGAGLWLVLVDKKRLEAVLLELLGNAQEALSHNGAIQIEVTNVRVDRAFVASRSGLALGDHVRVSVQDDGVGIPPDLAERVFNPFFTSKGGDAHLGLGLSVVHGFMCQSGGLVEIRHGDSPGATIDLYFPRAQAQANPSELNEQTNQP